MKTNDLKSALTEAAKLMTSKPVISELDFFKFTPCIDGVLIQSTNLTAMLSVTIPGQIFEPFLLHKSILKALPKIEASQVQFNTGSKIEIKAGSDSFKFETLPVDQFPVLKTGGYIVAAVDSLSELKEHKPYRGKDDTRPALCGTFFEMGDNLQVTTTSAHILRTATISNPLKDQLSFIAPGIVCDIVSSWNETGIYKGDNIEFRSENKAIAFMPIDQIYPKYRVVIPEDNPIQMQVSKKDLLKVISKASIFANPVTKKIVFSIKGSLSISAEDTGASYTGKVECGHQGEDLNIGFNYALLETLVKGQGETINFEFSTPTRGAVINSGPVLSLIMPVCL